MISNITELAFKGVVLRQQVLNDLIKETKKPNSDKNFVIYEKNSKSKAFVKLGSQIDVVA